MNRSFLLLCAALIASSCSSLGQQPAPSSASVNVPFLVEAQGSPVAGLSSKDVTILDNKKPPQTEPIIHAASETPLRLGVLIDTSSSQARYPLFKPGLQALSDFVDSALKGPQDKVFFVTFNVTPDGTGFMSREESQTQKPKIAIRGGTALYDAVYMACKDRIQDDDVQPARRVLLVFSDGEDNQSHVTRSAAIVAAGESGTMIFTVSISNVMGETRGDIVLKEFAKSTGGDAFLGVNARSLPKVLTSIREKIEEMYVATYVPADAVGPGRIHTVAFKVASEKKLKVQAPEGY